MDREIKAVRDLKVGYVGGEIIVGCPHCKKEVMRMKMNYPEIADKPGEKDGQRN